MSIPEVARPAPAAAMPITEALRLAPAAPLADTTVSALWTLPPEPLGAYVLAHGAGAGMEHAFLRAVAEGLAARSIAVLRYQFPSMERGARRVDPPPVAHATVRAACAEAVRRFGGRVPIAAGGKSFGGRMSSQAEALEPLAGVAGLAFIGFPLHPAGKPSLERAQHLERVGKPMLFLQGTRDALADLALLEPRLAALPTARLATFEGADHGFHVAARSGRRDDEVLAALLETLARWIVALPA